MDQEAQWKRIESALEKLMDNGWSEEDIRARLDETLKGLRDDG